MRKVKITKVDVSQGKACKTFDYVAEEKPLHLFVGKICYATVFCSPSNLKQLTVGHLLSEGIVKSIVEVDKISLDRVAGVCKVKLMPDIDVDRRIRFSKPFSRLILSTCGGTQPYEFSGKIPKVRSQLTVKSETISDCVQRLNALARNFRETGGVHIASIFKDDGSLVVSAEDIGRHNAVDKVVGAAALKRINLSVCFLALSGRLSGDIVFKAANVGLPIVASLAAGIDSGIAMAENTGLTLVGFVRGKRMNVYTFPERILP